jgi:hypothetical protein
MKKYKIYFVFIVLMCFTSNTIFGQKGIDCGFLEQVLKEQISKAFYVCSYFSDTIYIYERDSIKYFADCDLSHINTKKKYIVINEIPKNYNVFGPCVLHIYFVKIKKNTITIGFAPSSGPNYDPQIMAMTILTYRKKHGKYKLISYGQS